MRLGATFIFVTHDQVEAMTMGDRIGVLNNGHVVQVGTPYEIYRNPRDTFVAGFVGSPAINLLHRPHSRRQGRDGWRRSRLAPGANPAGRRRPGRGAPSASGPKTCRSSPVRPSTATVHDIENHGIEKIVTLRVGDVLSARRDPGQGNDRGRRSGPLRLEPRQGHVL